jgi:hypothetical protein
MTVVGFGTVTVAAITADVLGGLGPLEGSRPFTRGAWAVAGIWAFAPGVVNVATDVLGAIL